MTELFLKILNMSITASVLVLLVMILRLLLKKAPKGLHVLLWGLVAVRLICPFAVESEFSLIPKTEWVQEETTAMNPNFSSIPDTIPAFDSSLFGENITIQYDKAEPQIEIHKSVSIPFVLSCVWAAGMAVMLIYLLISYFRVYRSIRMAKPFQDNIYTGDMVPTPFVFGLVKPRIYLPENMDSVDMSYVIAHEQAHIRRHDHWWKPFGFLLLTLHWFNPVMWAAYVLLCRDIEMACDERVVKDMADTERAEYSDALLGCSISHGSTGRIISACPLAFGEVGVKTRIKSVLSYKKPAFWVIVAAVLLCVIAAVCFMTNPLTVRNPWVQEYLPGTGNILGNVDTEKYEAVSEDFAIGADKYGRAVFKDPLRAFDTMKELYSEGLDLIREENDLPAISQRNYEIYKKFGWQTTTGTPEAVSQASFISGFLDIYENSFTKEKPNTDLPSPTVETLSISDYNWYFEREFIEYTDRNIIHELYQPGLEPETAEATEMNAVLLPDDEPMRYTLITGDWDTDRCGLHFITMESGDGFANYTVELYRDTGEFHATATAVMEAEDGNSGYRLTLYSESLEMKSEMIFTTHKPPAAADAEKKLTYDDVIRLSKKGMALTWEDFAPYEYTDIGSGWFVCQYEIDETFVLTVGGGSMTGTPMYIHLALVSDSSVYIDLRRQDAEMFIREHDPTIRRFQADPERRFPGVPAEAEAYANDIVSEAFLTKYNGSGSSQLLVLEGIPTAAFGLSDGIYLYRMEYYIGKSINGWREGEDPKDGSYVKMYFAMHRDWSTGKDVWIRIGTLSPEDLAKKYSSNELNDKYGNAYTAAAVEMWNNYQSAELSPPINVTEITKSSLSDTTLTYIHDDSDYTRYIFIRANEALRNFRVLSMTLDANGMVPDRELYSLAELTPATPFCLGVVFYGDMTTYGLTFTDENGSEYGYMISESGMDGSIVVRPMQTLSGAEKQTAIHALITDWNTDGQLELNLVEYVTSDESDRIADLGLEDAKFLNGYEILDPEDKRTLMKLPENTTFVFFDWGDDFTNADDPRYTMDGRWITTQDIEIFVQYLETYNRPIEPSDEKSYPKMPFLIEVTEDSERKTVRITEIFIM